MIVALRAPDGQPHPDSRGRIGSVNGVLNVVLFVNRATFACGDVAPIETGGDELIKRRFRQEVPCQLLSCKLVKRHIFIKCLNHPISVGPHFTVVI